jgi:tetratricopeptide (TPR) repeat protein
VIVKPDDNEAKLLDRSLRSFKGNVDKFFITITGENSKVEEVAKKYNADISYIKWGKDFSKARNFNFSRVDKSFDFIGWSDADDIVENPQNIKNVLAKASPKVGGIVVNYDYDHDEYGNVTVSHPKLRIVRREADYEWVGVIHENLMDEVNTPIAKTDLINIVHKSENSDKATTRNLEIIEAEVKRQRDEGKEVDPRLTYYLGITYKALGIHNVAEEILRIFTRMSGWDEQRYDAYLNLAEIALEAGKENAAIDYALLAVKEKPEFPDACYLLGKIYKTFSRWEKARDWILLGFNKKAVYGDWITVARKPQALGDIAEAYTNLGQFKEANKYLLKLQKLMPKEKAITKNIDLNNKLQKEKDVVNAFFKIERYNRKSNKLKNRKLVQAIPQNLFDNPALLRLKWKYQKPEQWADNSIVIYCGESWEEWNPTTIASGIGGSEEAVIYLSQELTKLGYKVTVYNSCGEDKDYDGVTYKNYWEFNGGDKFNILIGWRTPGFFSDEFDTKKKYLWLHDVYPDKAFSKNILKNLDKVIVLSKYHRNLFPSIPEDKILYSANGIVQEQFSVPEKKQKNRMIYGSCPSRGLEILVDAWPKVLEKDPNAELHVFYGWDNFIKGNNNYPHKMQWMEQLKEKMKQKNIFDHGRVGHKEIAKEYLKADLWPYPCIFPEISCISAMKAQVAGAIPIVVPFGAVDETVQYGYKTEGLDALQQEVVDEYVANLLDAMDKPRDKDFDAARAEMIDWAKKTYNWGTVAKQWSEEFNA